MHAGRLTGADKIELKVGKLINRYKMAKHFTLTITDSSLSIDRDQHRIDAGGRPGRYLRHPHQRPRRPTRPRRRHATRRTAQKAT